jgi:L-aspartate oxidase
LILEGYHLIEREAVLMREHANLPVSSAAPVQTFDVVIVGAGAAGLYAALNLDHRLTVAVLNKLGPIESNSYYAQGGIAAVTLPTDNWASHLHDTLVAGAGLCDEAAVKVLVQEGPGDIQQLIKLGVPFDRDENGQVKLCMEGAHSCNRILHCGGDATGYHLTRTLIDAVKLRSNITILSFMTLFDVLTDQDGRVAGVLVQDDAEQFINLRAGSVILATGGIGRVYRNSTNSACATGDGIAAAIRAGAKVKDMEFVQFHPTAMIHPDENMRYFLISEALRGEGAVLRNRRWEPFMQSVHPRADLAPRDIVARAIVREMKRFDLPNVYLDITAKPRAFLRERFPVIYEECMKRGIDMAVNWIPVMPVQHYFMGGIKTDIHGLTNIDGLYASGESACTGVHGANRLASNSLLECLVFGRRCAQSINGLTSHTAPEAAIPSRDRLLPVNANQDFDFETCRTLIRNTMTIKGGIIRNEVDLSDAIKLVDHTLEELRSLQMTDRIAIETLNMATVADKILQAALQRKKSIGAHFREDDQPDIIADS